MTLSRRREWLEIRTKIRSPIVGESNSWTRTRTRGKPAEGNCVFILPVQSVSVCVCVCVCLHRRNERIHFCPGQKHAPLPGTRATSRREVLLSCFFQRSMVLYEHEVFEGIRWELVKPVRDNVWRKNYAYITEA